MDNSRQFPAPWGKLLALMTLMASFILLGIPFIGLFSGPVGTPVWTFLMVAMPLAIYFGAMMFMVKGYSFSADYLYIHRLLWKTPVSLNGLTSVEVNPEAMKKSFRSFGNGGLFSFSGHFWNKTLGSYRAFVTDPSRSVILTIKGSNIVVSPDKPIEFKECCERIMKLN